VQLRLSGGKSVMSSLDSVIVSTKVGVSSPAIIRNKVVLPDPLSPNNVKNSPFWADIETLLSATILPN
jgi:hypothetical protein